MLQERENESKKPNSCSNFPKQTKNKLNVENSSEDVCSDGDSVISSDAKIEK